MVPQTPYQILRVTRGASSPAADVPRSRHSTVGPLRRREGTLVATTSSAQAPRERERTINYYEIVEYKSATHNERMQHVDWQGIFSKLEMVPLGKRVWSGPDRTLIGDILIVDGVRHLKLMRVRDESSWLEIYDPTASTVDELRLGEQGMLLETSIVAFLDFGNVVGLIQGSTVAPSATALAQWINGLAFLGKGVTVDTEPMISHGAAARLAATSEVSRLEVKMHTSRASALEKRGSRLSEIFQTIKAEWGPMTVTVIMQASRARDDHEGRRALRAEADKVVAVADGNDLKRARASLVYVDAGEESHTEAVDFVKQRITAKRKISTTSADGSPIRNESAVRAVMEVARENLAELRTIVGQVAP